MRLAGSALFCLLLILPLHLSGCEINFEGEAITYPLETTNGDFSAVVEYPVGNQPIARVVADMNGDGHMDLVVLNQLETVAADKAARLDAPGTIQFLINDGTGVFTVVEGPSPGVRPSSLQVGELNGDGKLDLAMFTDDATAVLLLLSGADGAWDSRKSLLGGTGASLVLTDLNGDGAPALDLLVALAQPEAVVDPGKVLALVNDGTGGVTQVASEIADSSPANTPIELLVGDWNQDGLVDLVVRDGNAERKEVLVLKGLGDGSFDYKAWGNIVLEGLPTRIIQADMNADTIPDLLISSSQDYSVTLVTGDGAGGFSPLEKSPFLVRANEKGPEQLLVGQFTPEGLDFVALHRSTGEISLMDGDGEGNFEQIVTAVGYDPFVVSSGDFNGDGHLDLLLNERRDRTLGVLAGAGDGKFTHTVVGFAESLGPHETVDLDGNGMPDVVMLYPDMDMVLVLMNCHPAPGEPCP